MLSIKALGPVLLIVRYKFFLRFLIIVGFGVSIGLNWMLKENNLNDLIICFGFLGAVVVPLMPVVFQTAVECTHPVPEEYATGKKQKRSFV